MQDQRDDLQVCFVHEFTNLAAIRGCIWSLTLLQNHQLDSNECKGLEWIEAAEDMVRQLLAAHGFVLKSGTWSSRSGCPT